MTPLQLWGGVECTVNRIGDRIEDQIANSGHSRRIDDLDRFAALGFNALRYPVLWEHVAPDAPDVHTWTWADSRLARIRELGMRPIVGLLHHGSGPAYTSLVDPAFPELFARYARAAAERYPWVTDWTPINEPLTTARFSALYGHWYPHATNDAAFVTALLQEIRATVLAMREIRAVNPQARLIQTEDAGRSFGTARVAAQVEFEEHRRWLTWDLLAGRVNADHPMRSYLRRAGASARDLDFFLDDPRPADVLGLNYYVTSDRWLDDHVARHPESARGGNGRVVYADVEAVRARPEGIVGHEQILRDAWTRYDAPVAITEVHLGCTREEQLRWLLDAWQGAQRARESGVPAVAVTAWALLGSYDWDSLVTRPAGHYEAGFFDVRSIPPRPTALASMARQLAGGDSPRHPVLAVPGWWRRLNRSSASETRVTGSAALAQPILIVGARGTLGQAFQRVCALRGLPSYLAGRTEMELSDPARVDATLRRVKPWAVINAAGFVRVDAAESERTACWRDNTEGPVTLAAACRRRGVPLVTFSSDLVFDGSLQRPYVETDPVSPLNVYGASKAETERRVLELLPGALIVRTSAFFGPWDEHNFATQLARAVSRDEEWRAPDDYTVSPTYVPDLAHATLDLLIDGECGIWHLANPGAVTWFEFGRAIAEGIGVPGERVMACRASEVWQPARRPSYSVLGSSRGVLLRPLDEAIGEFCEGIAPRLAAEAAAG